jgi:hypothetical protein
MSTAYEPLLAFIAAQLPQPVKQHEEEDGTLVFTGGDPPEVIVRLTRSAVLVAEYSLQWRGPHTAIVKPIHIGSVRWGRVSEEGAMRVVKALITTARNTRLARFRVCSMCEQRNPPEGMHSDDVCQGCAERELGVVH